MFCLTVVALHALVRSGVAQRAPAHQAHTVAQLVLDCSARAVCSPPAARQKNNASFFSGGLFFSVNTFPPPPA
jgi:hypothetical protein